MNSRILFFSFKRLSVFSLFFAVFLGLVFFFLSWNHVFALENLEVISLADDESFGNEDSFRSSITPDGRFVVFTSRAQNLVTTPITPFTSNVYLRDRVNNTTELVSLADDESIPNDNSLQWPPGISGDGRFVVFTSAASNLVPNDTNQRHDIFVRDRLTNTTERVSVATDGTQGNENSSLPTISPDGRYVTFYSRAVNLTPETTDFIQGAFQRDFAFVHDRYTHTTKLASIFPNGDIAPIYSPAEKGPSISNDGRFVTWIADEPSFEPGQGGDRVIHVYVRDVTTNSTLLIDKSSSGTIGNLASAYPVISGNGNYVVFSSSSTNLVTPDTNNADDVFVHELSTGTTERISNNTTGDQGDSASYLAEISDDGRFVGFQSDSNNFVAGIDKGIFIRDLQTNTTELVYDWKDTFSMSTNSRFFAFDTCRECTFVPEDTNNWTDVYFIDRGTEVPGVANLELTMVDSPDPTPQRNEVTYTIEVTNNGPETADNVLLTDQLPIGPRFISAITTQGTCLGNDVISCNLGSILNGESVIVTITIKPSAIGSITNYATVWANQADSDISNNSSTEGTTVASTDDLSKLKVAIQGNGTVTSNPTGINCHPNCLVYFYPGTQVTLTATPLPGYDFIGWAFDCAFAGTSPTCTLTADSNLTAKAKFTRR